MAGIQLPTRCTEIGISMWTITCFEHGKVRWWRTPLLHHHGDCVMGRCCRQRSAAENEIAPSSLTGECSRRENSVWCWGREQTKGLLVPVPYGSVLVEVSCRGVFTGFCSQCHLLSWWYQVSFKPLLCQPHSSTEALVDHGHQDNGPFLWTTHYVRTPGYSSAAAHCVIICPWRKN